LFKLIYDEGKNNKLCTNPGDINYSVHCKSMLSL
jgi:hypothetical protein